MLRSWFVRKSDTCYYATQASSEQRLSIAHDVLYNVQDFSFFLNRSMNCMRIIRAVPVAKLTVSEKKACLTWLSLYYTEAYLQDDMACSGRSII